MATFAPTQEQEDIRDAFASGDSLVVEALAGTGKTTTLKMLANDHPELKMTYAAFNKAIATDAQRSFPRNVTARTMHSFAYGAVGKEYASRLQGGFVPMKVITRVLKIPSVGFNYGKFSLMDQQVARLVNEAVQRFCHSTDPFPTTAHMPRVPGMDTFQARMDLNAFLLPFVEKAWLELQQPEGELKFSHDVYLKLWSMGDPRLPGDVVLFDEAQDADPVILEILRKNAERGARIVPVGDANQQIYAWRGAVNSLDMFEAVHRLPLQKSFRFGPVIAERANLILDALDTDLRLEGHEPVGSQLAVLDAPDAILCRTNAEAVGQLMSAQVAGVQAGLVGGTTAVESLAKAAKDLAQGRRTWHPDLMAFSSWAEVQGYVKDYPNESRDIAVLVKLIDQFGPETLLDAVARAVPEESAQLVISTAHKAKGREWDRVRIAHDFADPRDDEGAWNEAELRLAYVSVTRAKELLDDMALPFLSELSFGEEPERLSAAAVTPRVVEQIAITAIITEREQVICDPESKDMLVMHKTRYNPEMVAAQRNLPGRRYRGEYCGMERVNIVRATASALALAEAYRLTVSEEARRRVEELGLA